MDHARFVARRGDRGRGTRSRRAARESRSAKPSESPQVPKLSLIRSKVESEAPFHPPSPFPPTPEGPRSLYPSGDLEGPLSRPEHSLEPGEQVLPWRGTEHKSTTSQPSTAWGTCRGSQRTPNAWSPMLQIRATGTERTHSTRVREACSGLARVPRFELRTFDVFRPDLFKRCFTNLPPPRPGSHHH